MHLIFLHKESSGLLLLNCPCIEVLGDLNYSEFECCSLDEYKSMLNEFHQSNHKIDTLSFIKMNFNDLLIKNLQKNYNDFKNNDAGWESSNVMMHPEYLIKMNEDRNIRTGTSKKDYHCLIRYFSTAIYVIIAFTKGFSKYNDSYNYLLNYLYEIKKNEEKELFIHISKIVDQNIISIKDYSQIVDDPILIKKVFGKMEEEKIITKRQTGKKRKLLVTSEELRKKYNFKK